MEEKIIRLTKEEYEELLKYKFIVEVIAAHCGKAFTYHVGEVAEALIVGVKPVITASENKMEGDKEC